MAADDLADWLTERFGTRDERLVTDPGLDDDLRELIRQERIDIDRYRRQHTEWRNQFEQLVGEGLPPDDPERTVVKTRAEAAMRKAERAAEQVAGAQRRLTAMLVVEVLRETGEGVPTPDETRQPVTRRLREAEIPLDRLEAVHAALAIDDPDPLAWVPELLAAPEIDIRDELIPETAGDLGPDAAPEATFDDLGLDMEPDSDS